VIRLLLLVVLLPALAGGCTWLKRSMYEGFGRDDWQQPDRVVQALALEPGERVADLGAGGGYFTFRLARAVGPTGRVYAVDVDQGMLDHVAERTAEEGVANVETVLATPTDPNLPAGSVDLVFTCNTYHHIEDRPAYFAALRGALRPGGRVAIVEYLPEGFFQSIFPHSTDAATIESEMRAAGYALEQRHDFLERQAFLVFVPVPG
jgi:ubiquinone/menaquinone biosynthesis C-methylase UbiE